MNKSNIVQFRQRDCDDDGLCPECHREPSIINLRDEKFGICETHKLRWYVGQDKFMSGRKQSTESFNDNIHILETSKWVKGFNWPVLEGSAA